MVSGCVFTSATTRLACRVIWGTHTSRDLFLVTAMSRAFFLFGAHIFLDSTLSISDSV